MATISWDWKAHRETWNDHPPEYEGAWMRLLNQLYPKGYAELTIKDYARISGLIDNNIEEFIEFLAINKIAEIQYVDNKVSIKCRRIYRAYKKRKQNLERVRTFRVRSSTKRSPMCIRRTKLLEELRENYHPKRAQSQKKQQYKLYETILKQSSRATRNGIEKEKLEKEEHFKILKYIESLKLTKQWLEGGKYLPGLGKLLREKQWIYKETSKGQRTSEQKELAALLGD